MYDLQYVKKRRRRKIAALVSLFTGIAITSLVIVSFLGRTVGTFSVKLTNSDVRLSLSEKKTFKPSSSYLNVGELYPLRETTYGDLPADYILDSEELETLNDYNKRTNGEGNQELTFIKYTFYIRNTGKTTAQYNLSIKITDIKVSTDGSKRYLDDTLRIMVFENDLNATVHKKRIFAKEASQRNHIDNQGYEVNREFVSEIPADNTEPAENDPNYEKYRLAESFVSSSIAAKFEVGNFGTDAVKRYTLVAWLEGFDPNTENSKDPPEGASLKLGVDISAYEYEGI